VSTTLLDATAERSANPHQDGAWSENGDVLYEVLNGQRVELPPMSAYATWISSRLFGRLFTFTDSTKVGTPLAEMLFVLDHVLDVRRRPDVGFVSAAKWPLDRPLPESGDWAIIPDLAVEVVSPNDTFYQVMAKMKEYFQYGVGQVWIVSPQDRQVLVYSSPTSNRIWSAGEELDGDPILPGFRLRIAELFGPETKKV
jgi:Uma2 family endonuclease